jgi:hypothetical protein
VLLLLFNKAEENGLISEDEKQIIDSVELSVERYEKELEKALEDGILTEDEIFLLVSLKKDILLDAWNKAEDDWQLSKEEEELIVLLQVFLANLSFPETP